MPLTLLLPSINMAGQHEQEFDTIAIKTISSGMLPTTGAQLTYEVSSLQGTAQHLLHPLYTWQGSLPDEPKDAFKAIADEILKMSERDQKMRKSGQWDSSIDVEHTQRMKEMVEQIGWPTRSKVGGHASEMAWLLVQHADHDRAFQQRCLISVVSAWKALHMAERWCFFLVRWWGFQSGVSRAFFNAFSFGVPPERIRDTILW